MKKTFYPLTIITLFMLTILFLFTNSIEINKSIIFSFNLFLNNVFPSLFPMFIISYILIEIGLPEFLGCIFSKIFKTIFKTKKEASFVFFMSMLTGFPSSAKYIDQLINKKLINEQDANKILTFTFFSNPLFIINTIGIMFFKNIKYGYILLISHIIGNIITGIIFRNYNKTQDKNKYYIKKSTINLINKINNTSFFNTFLNSIKDSLNTMILILGTIITFQIIITILNSNIITSGIIEMTTGLKLLSLSNLTIKTKLIISSFFISFGGLSIHSQIMNILNEKKVKYLPFLISRILHGTISSIITIIIFMMLES